MEDNILKNLKKVTILLFCTHIYLKFIKKIKSTDIKDIFKKYK